MNPFNVIETEVHTRTTTGSTAIANEGHVMAHIINYDDDHATVTVAGKSFRVGANTDHYTGPIATGTSATTSVTFDSVPAGIGGCTINLERVDIHARR